MQLEEFCSSFSSLIKGKDKSSTFYQEGQALLSGLLADTGWFTGFLQKIIMDTAFRDQQKASRWLNEYLVYRSPDRSFVMLAYIWEPRQIDIIHDHNSWGIVGILSGKVIEKKYRRIDDGSKEGYAELEETFSGVMNPCDTTVVQPLEKGIHHMINFDDFCVSIHVYGRPVRKGYLNYYDMEKKTVARTYAYPYHRAALAIKTLGSIDGTASKNILQQAIDRSTEDILKKEMELSLRRSENAGRS